MKRDFASAPVICGIGGIHVFPDILHAVSITNSLYMCTRAASTHNHDNWCNVLGVGFDNVGWPRVLAHEMLRI